MHRNRPWNLTGIPSLRTVVWKAIILFVGAIPETV